MKALSRLFHSNSYIGKPTYISRSFFGYNLTLDVSRSDAQIFLYLDGERFIQERFLLSRLLKKGMTVIDIGANIGYYMLMIEKHIGHQGRLILVEPSPENLPELKINIEKNEFSNVVLHEIAIGNRSGIIGIKSGINSGITDKSHGRYQVKIKTLDSIVKEKVDFLKIDVEGFEGQVLEGAKEILRRYRPILFLEIHPHILKRYEFSSKSIITFLKNYYEILEIYMIKNCPNESLIERIIKKYIVEDEVYKIEESSEFITKCDSGKVQFPYWVVCI